jgi:hypothetical protein
MAKPPPDTTDYRQRTLEWLGITVPFEILKQRQLRPEQRIALAQDAWQPIIDCEDTTAGRKKTQYSGGAALMFGGPTYQDERRRLMVVLAAMAYQPGGITWMGRHWCVNHAECVEAERQAAENPINLSGPPAADSKPDTTTYQGRPVIDLPTLF